MKLFDNCLINGAESRDLNISQLEFAAEERRGLFMKHIFKGKVCLSFTIKKGTNYLQECPRNLAGNHIS